MCIGYQVGGVLSNHVGYYISILMYSSSTPHTGRDYYCENVNHYDYNLKERNYGLT